VLGEVANASMAFDLIQLLGDDLDELRAAAARALSNGQPGLAFDSLSQLAEDPIWFVRLRAIVSLGKISNPRALPVLLRGLTDSNRLVRLRSAESLIQLRHTIGLALYENAGGAPKPVDELEKAALLSVFEQVVALKDRYGLHAFMTALENANLRGKLEAEIRQNANLTYERRIALLEVLETGRPPVEAVAEDAPVQA
jgi:HEAT repeat protein